jgi:hypothetical protein
LLFYKCGPEAKGLPPSFLFCQAFKGLRSFFRAFDLGVQSPGGEIFLKAQMSERQSAVRAIN